MNEYFATVNALIKKRISFDGNSTIFLDGEKISGELVELNKDSIILKLNNKFYELKIESKNGEMISLNYEGNFYEVNIRTELQERANQILESEISGKPHSQNIKSPMPGMIVKINFKIGEKMMRGDTVLVLEAMKMENEIKSPSECFLKEIFVSANKSVEKGQILFSIE